MDFNFSLEVQLHRGVQGEAVPKVPGDSLGVDELVQDVAGVIVVDAHDRDLGFGQVTLGSIGTLRVSGHEFDALADRGIVRQRCHRIITGDNVRDWIRKENHGFRSENLSVPDHAAGIEKLVDSQSNNGSGKVKTNPEGKESQFKARIK